MSIKASIDIGSSSVKLLVLELAAGGAYRILAEESRVTGLGKGVAKTGLLGPDEVAATLSCISEMARLARGLGAESIRAAGTDALRRARNPEALLEPLRADCGLEVEVLSGSEEARLSRAVALRELPGAARDVVFFDVGGGSTELTWCTGGVVRGEASLGLGARRCSELAGIVQPVAAGAQARLEALIREELERSAPHPAGTQVQLAGLGGTASQLVWALRGWRGEPKGEAHGAVVGADELRGAVEKLAPMALEEVERLVYMDAARAGIVFAGAVVIDGLLRFYRAPSFTVVDRGLRYGLLLG